MTAKSSFLWMCFLAQVIRIHSASDYVHCLKTSRISERKPNELAQGSRRPMTALGTCLHLPWFERESVRGSLSPSIKATILVAQTAGTGGSSRGVVKF